MDLQILVDEVGRILIVGEDAAYFRRGENDEFGTGFGVESANCCRVEQIEFFMRLADEMAVTEPLQLAPDRAPDETAMARNIDS